ncbi:MAG: AI-2E family transporter [Candidatus Pacearchaeota archaeon]
MVKEDGDYFKKITATLIIVGLLVLLFFILKPILLSIVLGVILAFIFFPIYSWIYKKTKSKNFSATAVCLLLVLVILIPLILLLPYIVEQLISSYSSLKQIDLITPLKAIFSTFIDNDSIFVMVENAFESAVNNLTTSLLNSLTLDNIVSIGFGFVVVFFTLFFTLRDNEELNNYIKSLLPFPKEVEKKLYESSKEITGSILYGQVIIGMIQGFSIGLGFFIFSVPNALFLTLLALIGGILPLFGTAIIWVPVLIYLIVAGNTSAAFGILIFGLFSSTIDNILRPLFISRKANLSSSLALIGMIGGWFFFGILGIILGPLVVAYFLIIIETYRNKHVPGLIINEKNN